MANGLSAVNAWQPPGWFRAGLAVLTAYLLALGGMVAWGFTHQDALIREACETSLASDRLIARDVVEAIAEEVDAEPARTERVIDAAVRRAEARHNC